MRQYVIIAYDGTDEKALERRMETRPLHFKGASKLKAANQLIAGGAILDDKDTMRGSVMIVQFETEEEFNNWYNNEPYITGNVWQQIEIKPFRLANVK